MEPEEKLNSTMMSAILEQALGLANAGSSKDPVQL